MKRTVSTLALMGAMVLNSRNMAAQQPFPAHKPDPVHVIGGRAKLYNMPDSARTKDGVRYPVKKNDDAYFHGHPPGQPLSPREKRELTVPLMIGGPSKLFQENTSFLRPPYLMQSATPQKNVLDTIKGGVIGW